MGARKLDPRSAVVARHCDLEAGDIRAFSPIAELGVVASSTMEQKSGFVFDSTRMFVFPNDVDCTYGPIRVDDVNDNRVYMGYGWQDFPIYSTLNLGLPDPTDTFYGPPVNWRKLGVEVPTVPAVATVPQPKSGTCRLYAGNPTVVQVLVSGADVGTWGVDIQTGTRLRLAGFTDDDWLRVNNNVFVVERLPDDSDYYDEFIILRSLNSSDLIADGDEDANQIFEGVATSECTASEDVGFTHEYEIAQIEDRLYVYTLVTDLGEEGAPSEASNLVSVGVDQVVTVVTPTGITGNGVVYATKRIYRTVTGSNGIAKYYFVAEVDMADGTYLDELDSIALGEELPSEEWYPPPAELRGLTVLPNGVMAGFRDRELYLSEPYQPHAYPDAHIKTMDNEIVGIAAFGQQLVVATKENPYIGTATDPRSMTFSKLDSIEPCISKRTMKSLGYGVIYASSNGLILVRAGGVKNVVENFWDEKEWRALFDTYSDSFAEVHDGRYYLTFFDSDTDASLSYVFDPGSETMEITSLEAHTTSGMLVDRDEDRLFLLGQGTAPLGPRVMEWNPDNANESEQATWRSKEFVMPMPLNMGIMQTFFSSDGQPVWGTTEIEFFCDGVSKGVYTVTDEEPQRLASGFMARDWQIEIRTTQPIEAIYVAETVEELRGAMS
jgi:hypothetical protein